MRGDEKNLVEIISKHFMHHMDLLMVLTYVDELYILTNSLEYTLQHLYMSRMPTEIQLCRAVGLYYTKIELKKRKVF